LKQQNQCWLEGSKVQLCSKTEERLPIAMGQLHQPDQEIEEWHLNKQWVMYSK
jgi:hypothetical protein